MNDYRMIIEVSIDDENVKSLIQEDTDLQKKLAEIRNAKSVQQKYSEVIKVLCKKTRAAVKKGADLNTDNLEEQFDKKIQFTFVKYSIGRAMNECLKSGINSSIKQHILDKMTETLMLGVITGVKNSEEIVINNSIENARLEKKAKKFWEEEGVE